MKLVQPTSISQFLMDVDRHLKGKRNLLKNTNFKTGFVPFGIRQMETGHKSGIFQQIVLAFKIPIYIH